MKYYEKYPRYRQYPDFSLIRAETLNDDLKTWHIGIPIGSHPVDAEVVLKEGSILKRILKMNLELLLIWDVRDAVKNVLAEFVR